jgi:hypothetical protein
MTPVEPPTLFAGLLQRRQTSAYRNGRARLFLAASGLWLLSATGLAVLDSSREPASAWALAVPALLWLALLGIFWRAHRNGRCDQRLVLARLEAARPELGQLFSTAAWTLDNPEAGRLAADLREEAVTALGKTPNAGGVDPRGLRIPTVLAVLGLVAISAFVALTDAPAKTLRRVLFFDTSPYSELAFSGLPAELLPDDGVAGEVLITGRPHAEIRLRTSINGGVADERILTVRGGRAAVIIDAPGGEVLLEARAGDAAPVSVVIPFVAPPKLVRPQVVIIPPAYTQQKERTLKDKLEVEVLEGSTLVFSTAIEPKLDQLKSVATGTAAGTLTTDGAAEWQGGDVALTAMAKLGKGELTLQVRNERAMDSNIQKLAVEVLADAMPEATVDGEETETGVILKGALTDDVGLGKTGMFMIVQGKEVELKIQSVEGKSKGIILVAELTREQLGVTDEETVMVFSWAEDLAPQHAGQRTLSDPLEIVVPKNGDPPKPQKPDKPKKPEKKPKKLELKKDLEQMAAVINKLADQEEKLSKEAGEPGSDAQANAAQQQQAASRLEKVREKMAELLPGAAELAEAAEAAAKAIQESTNAFESSDAAKGAKGASEAAALLKELGTALGGQSGSPEEQAEAAAQQALQAAEALEATPSAEKSSAAGRAAAGLGRATGSPKAGELSKQLAKAGEPSEAKPGPPSDAQKEADRKSEEQRKALAAELKEEARKTLAKAAEEKLKQEAATLRANELARKLMEEARNKPPGQNPQNSGDGPKPPPQPGDDSPPSDQESDGQGTQKGNGKSLAKALGQSGADGLVQEGENLENAFKRGEIPSYQQLAKIFKMTEERLSELAAQRKRRLTGKEAAGTGAELTRKYLQELSDDATPDEPSRGNGGKGGKR